MRTLYKPYLWFILLLFGAIGCQQKSVAPPMPDVGVSPQEMNKRFTVQAPRGINTFRTKDIVQLAIKLIPNDPQDQLAFQYNLGARLFIEQKDQWVEIKNAVNYRQDTGKIILSPSDPWGNSNGAFFKPALPDVTKTTVVRFILIGNIIKNGDVTEEKTGAYIDVTLKP
jgi:hypothetical protein